MEFPRQFGSLDRVKGRFKKAFAENEKWDSLLEDVYELFLPNRNLYDRFDTGQNKQDRLFDETAPLAIQQGASKLQENIAPIWVKWAIFEIAKEIQNDIEASGGEIDVEQIRKSLDDQSEVMFDYINRSNFSTQFYEMALDLLIGTGTTMVQEEQDETLFSFHSTPQKFIAFEEGPNGSIENHFRKHKVKAGNVERQWPGFKASDNLKRVIKESPNDDIFCHEAVLYEPETKTYHAMVWVDEEKNISWYEDYQDFSPFVTGRYAKSAGEIRGRGPAILVLPAVKSLNKIKEFVLTKSAIDLAGIWTATDSGVSNPYNITIAPGIVLPVGSNNTSNPSLARLDTSTQLDLTLFNVEDLQKTIKTALFNDLRDPDGPVRTATEIAMDARELAKRIGSAYGRLQTEVMVPILKRVMQILVRRGKIDPIVIDGKAVDIKFTSPLARSQDMEDVLNAQNAMEFTLNMGGPEALQVSFKTEDIGSWAAEKMGVPAQLIRSKAEKANVAQAGAQAEMMNGGPLRAVE